MWLFELLAWLFKVFWTYMFFSESGSFFCSVNVVFCAVICGLLVSLIFMFFLVIFSWTASCPTCFHFIKIWNLKQYSLHVIMLYLMLKFDIICLSWCLNVLRVFAYLSDIIFHLYPEFTIILSHSALPDSRYPSQISNRFARTGSWFSGDPIRCGSPTKSLVVSCQIWNPRFTDWRPGKAREETNVLGLLFDKKYMFIAIVNCCRRCSFVLSKSKVHTPASSQFPFFWFFFISVGVLLLVGAGRLEIFMFYGSWKFVCFSFLCFINLFV